jgi:hypothetical protein
MRRTSAAHDLQGDIRSSVAALAFMRDGSPDARV